MFGLPIQFCFRARIISVWTLLLMGTCQVAFPQQEEGEKLFVRRVASLLREKCGACHGDNPQKLEGELDLRTLHAMQQGGESETAAIVPGDPMKSPLYLAVLREDSHWSPMPPKESEQLTAQQIEWLKKWIEGGAPWPLAERIQEIKEKHAQQWSTEDGVTVANSGGQSEEWTHRKYQPDDLWAYQPIRTRSEDSNSQSIDNLVRHQWPEGLESAPLADRLTLIRRASLDLTGLPPSLESIQQFVNDPSDDEMAFATLVDRLLQSPHYGERMTQHWLDVVRYADSSGLANDYERGNAWRYRDYLVRSFNQDKPYDQFVREQIAGDEIDPNHPELLVATGFLRMGPWELTGMEVAKVARQRFLDDVVNSVGETFLAHSLQCARCHDHKFDPIPTRDYYSIQAAFATTQLTERPAAFLESENTSGFDESTLLERRRQEHLDALHLLDQQLLINAEQWFIDNGKDNSNWNQAVANRISNPTPNKRREFSDVFSAVRSELLKQKVDEGDFPPKLVGFTPEQFGAERIARKGLERLRWEMERYEPFAFSVYNGRTPTMSSVNAPMRIPASRLNTGELEDTCILPGGDPFAKGPSVTPGVLSALANDCPATIPNSLDGRRLALATWVANSKNPLTTRAIANRIWLWHFGIPIAGNPNNFGSTGKKPTHPELLDWLANSLVDHQWSIKSLHRIIMNSEAYRRGAVHPSPKMVARLDPHHSSYAVFQPRRLSAEELRDCMLFATSELNREMGGIPNRPEINLEAALQPRQVMGTFASAWVPNPKPQQRHRRSLYALKLRGLVDPMFEVLNVPASDFSCERRESSTVTPQVFSLFNSQSVHDRALALAHRAVLESQSDHEAISNCFRYVLLRSPSEKESQAVLVHWKQIESLIDTTEQQVRQLPREVIREAVEENTGEKFTFRERLHAYEQFIPDLQPTDVTKHVAALADVCLVLFNSNEFAYVY